jgi:hypothetical protein
MTEAQSEQGGERFAGTTTYRNDAIAWAKHASERVIDPAPDVRFERISVPLRKTKARTKQTLGNAIAEALKLVSLKDILGRFTKDG